jgi:hypothetical protein
MFIPLDYLVVIVISALAVASAFWFFRKRKELIVFLRDVTETLEKHFKPLDKSYVWLGYLVGYRAKFDLPGNHKAFILLTTVPRHSLFYLPIAKILNRKDRIEVAVVPYDRFVIGELHVHRRRSWTAEVIARKGVAEREHEFGVREFRTGEYSYVAYYRDEKVLDAVEHLMKDTELPILYVSTDPRGNIVTASCEITLDNLKKFLEFHRELARAMSRPKAST